MSPVSSRTIRMSSPATTSGLRLEASASSGNTCAGRRLANRPSSLRRPRIACSGRLARGRLSYFGSPTAPKSTASADFTRASVFSGSGSPWAAYAVPPTSASSNSRPSSSFFSTRRACAMISCPIPSPGRTATLLMSEVPGKLRLAPVLEGADLVRLAQREADLVEAVQQAVLAERVDVEAEALRVVGRRDGLAFQVDYQPEAGKRGGLVEQAIDLVLAQHHRQEAVLEAVGEENVGEGRRDHAAEAVVHQRPRRVLARRAAAEVLAREQDVRALVLRPVEHELRVAAPGGEQPGRVAGALDRLQVFLRDDLVGVDVGAVQRRDQPVQDGEFLHQRHSLTSTKWPAIAAAAAIAGLTRCVRLPSPWRPWKLRFEVDAQRSPALSRSSFMPRHIEQPGSRHSKPASRKILSRPSFSACTFTTPEPGTTIAWRMLAAMRRPFTTDAARRRSSMRELVQEPMKILSSLMSVMRVRGLSPM